MPAASERQPRYRKLVCVAREEDPFQEGTSAKKAEQRTLGEARQGGNVARNQAENGETA